MAAINLRDIPEELHRALKVRAAERGMKLYALILEYLELGLRVDRVTPEKPSQKKAKKKGGK